MGADTLPHLRAPPLPPTTTTSHTVQTEAEAYWTKWRAHDPEPGAAGYAGWDAFINETLIFGSETVSPAPAQPKVAARLPATPYVPAWIDLFPRSRAQLFFSLDNGYQDFSSNRISLDKHKFPSFESAADGDSIALMVKRVKAHGWRGLGLWIPGASLVSTHGESVCVIE